MKSGICSRKSYMKTMQLFADDLICVFAPYTHDTEYSAGAVVWFCKVLH